MSPSWQPFKKSSKPNPAAFTQKAEGGLDQHDCIISPTADGKSEKTTSTELSRQFQTHPDHGLKLTVHRCAQP